MVLFNQHECWLACELAMLACGEAMLAHMLGGHFDKLDLIATCVHPPGNTHLRTDLFPFRATIQFPSTYI